LAEGNFRVARFYYVRGAYKAAGARLLELANRYPLYSEADKANWMLGEIYEKGEHNDLAAGYYSRIVKDYPLSPLAGDAKAKLTKFGVPVPQPDPTAIARMQKDEQAARDRPGFIRRSTSILKSGPDVSAAAHNGPPTMTPASESGDETLSFGPQPATGVTGIAGANSAAVETVTPGSSDSTPLPAQPAADASAAAPSTPDNTANSPAPSTAADPNATQPTDSTNTNTAPPADKSKESTTKKKKGIHKVLPF
jgi:hypothetical protein